MLCFDETLDKDKVYYMIRNIVFFIVSYLFSTMDGLSKKHRAQCRNPGQDVPSLLGKHTHITQFRVTDSANYKVLFYRSYTMLTIWRISEPTWKELSLGIKPTT